MQRSKWSGVGQPVEVAMGRLITVVVVIAIAYLGFRLYSSMRLREIVVCDRCGNRMTRRRAKEANGCPICGSGRFQRVINVSGHAL